jgi:hypothetical protein
LNYDMTAEEKTNMARFLDLAAATAGNGYILREHEYGFEDDKVGSGEWGMGSGEKQGSGEWGMGNGDQEGNLRPSVSVEDRYSDYSVAPVLDSDTSKYNP